MLRAPAGQVELEVTGEPGVLGALEERIGDTVAFRGTIEADTVRRIQVTAVETIHRP